MKVTREQLQEYFAEPLPPVEEIADAFTFHAFEIDSIEGDMLDVKVLPNRTADCATPEGVARELAAILDLPLKGGDTPSYDGQPAVETTLAGINALLGADFTREEVLDVFHRLAFKVEEEGETLRVSAPLPRTDITIPEDIAEEVGQILGYDRVPATELPPMSGGIDQARFRGMEKIKDELVARGFIEVSTQSFAKQGDIYLANPFDKSKPALRTSLKENLQDALTRAQHYAPLVLEPKQKPKLFEIGSVFPKEGEQLEVATTEPSAVPEIQDAPDYEPVRYELGAYRPFSSYPFIARDIALWVPSSVGADEIEKVLRERAGDLLVRLDQFDSFEKEGRVSYAFRLVFQSMERTLTDDEVNTIMGKIAEVLGEKGYDVR